MTAREGWELRPAPSSVYGDYHHARWTDRLKATVHRWGSAWAWHVMWRELKGDRLAASGEAPTWQQARHAADAAISGREPTP